MKNKSIYYFKPVYREAHLNQWERVNQAYVNNKDDQTQLHFQFTFNKSAVYFAYSYPFGFQDNQAMLYEVQKQFKNHKSIYYCDEILIRSIEYRPIHLITISSKDLKLDYRQSIVNEYLFKDHPDKRAFKFHHQKPVVLITARVHPGQAPASHTFNGALKFLLSKDSRACELRRRFVFKLVPMLNPDGVAHGHYRMDTLNQNLNRYYLNPNPYKQPSAYAVRYLGQYYRSQKRLCFFMDMHAHPQRKGNFIYGNAMQSIQNQVQTQLYAKILSLNTVQFEYDNSSFSRFHMTHKDRNEQMTKQGCSRVIFTRDLQQIYSYTIQCGYTQSTYLNEILQIKNMNKQTKYKIIKDELDNIKSNYYQKKNVLFNIRVYENLGKNVIVSIGDLFQVNLFSRIPNTEFKNINGIRKHITLQLKNKCDPKAFMLAGLKSTDKQLPIRRNHSNSRDQSNKKRNILQKMELKKIPTYKDSKSRRTQLMIKSVNINKLVFRKINSKTLPKMK